MSMVNGRIVTINNKTHEQCSQNYILSLGNQIQSAENVTDLEGGAQTSTQCQAANDYDLIHVVHKCSGLKHKGISPKAPISGIVMSAS